MPTTFMDWNCFMVTRWTKTTKKTQRTSQK